MTALLRNLTRRALPVAFVVTFLLFGLAYWQRDDPVPFDLGRPGHDTKPEETFPSSDAPTGSLELLLPPVASELPQEPGLYDLELDLIVASIQKEDTAWFHRLLPDMHKSIYVADDPGAALTVPENKGRESMVYLSYIIDNYDTLPRNMLFVHASRFAWYNDDPDYDAFPALRNFRLPYLKESGYVNLRCVWVIGCPGEIRPLADAAIADGVELSVQEAMKQVGKDLVTKNVYKKIYEELFPGSALPEIVAVSCCSQFAVTRDAVRSRPKADYVRYRDWLLATPLGDDISGRIFEFSWHMIFHKQAVHCPPAGDCYCKTFGICDLVCPDGSSCTERYTLPPYSSLPKGWPFVGWDDEPRNFSGPPLETEQKS